MPPLCLAAVAGYCYGSWGPIYCHVGRQTPSAAPLSEGSGAWVGGATTLALGAAAKLLAMCLGSIELGQFTSRGPDLTIWARLDRDRGSAWLTGGGAGGAGRGGTHKKVGGN